MVLKRLKTTSRPREQIEINTEVSGKNIYIHIIDNGCGMSSKQWIICLLPFILLNQKGPEWDFLFVIKSLENI